jgi:phage tail sheath gpL-like
MRKPALLAALIILTASVAATRAVSADPAFTVQTLHFDVLAGPEAGQQAGQHCDNVGDLYTPAAATATHPVPAILTTNG